MKSFVQLPDYEVVSRIGRGAGAIIYHARQRGTRKSVAIKHVVRRGPEDDRFIEQAETEYEVAHRLDHPCLRACRDIIRIKRWMKVRELFLIMDLVEGARLDNEFQEKPPDDLAPIVDIFEKVAEGLHAMHRARFVHADIKPNNILLCRDGGVRIIDFGQSCSMGTQKTRIQGTPDFIAPEQVARQPLDQRTDVFNLGATMYWVLTGKAFSTVMPNAPAGAKKIEVDARRAFEAPHELNPQVPLSFSKLVMDCCATERDNRPWDMTKVISRLETTRHLLEKKQNPAAASGTE